MKLAKCSKYVQETTSDARVQHQHSHSSFRLSCWQWKFNTSGSQLITWFFICLYDINRSYVCVLPTHLTPIQTFGSTIQNAFSLNTLPSSQLTIPCIYFATIPKLTVRHTNANYSAECIGFIWGSMHLYVYKVGWTKWFLYKCIMWAQ